MKRERTAYQLAYRAANKERIAKQKKDYVSKNREQVLAGKAKYRLLNKEKINAYSLAYRAKKRKKVEVDLQHYYNEKIAKKRASDSRRRYIDKHFPNWWLVHLRKQEKNVNTKLYEACKQQDIVKHMLMLEGLKHIWNNIDNEKSGKRKYVCANTYNIFKSDDFKDFVKTNYKPLDYFPYVKTMKKLRAADKFESNRHPILLHYKEYVEQQENSYDENNIEHYL